MLLGVQLTLLAVLASVWQVERAAVVLGAVGTFFVVGGYRFD